MMNFLELPVLILIIRNLNFILTRIAHGKNGNMDIFSVLQFQDHTSFPFMA